MGLIYALDITLLDIRLPGGYAPDPLALLRPLHGSLRVLRLDGKHGAHGLFWGQVVHGYAQASSACVRAFGWLLGHAASLRAAEVRGTALWVSIKGTTSRS